LRLAVRNAHRYPYGLAYLHAARGGVVGSDKQCGDDSYDLAEL
jgi:hypothetical protein